MEVWGLFRDQYGVERWINITSDANGIIQAYQNGGFTLVMTENRNTPNPTGFGGFGGGSSGGGGASREFETNDFGFLLYIAIALISLIVYVYF